MLIGVGHAPLDMVAIDLNTQIDFCTPGGAYPVENMQRMLEGLQRCLAWTRSESIPTISFIDSHRPWELDREGLPRHCIDGTPGQRKLDWTMIPPSMLIEGDNTLVVSISLFDHFRQVIFRKRGRDLFSNPKADRFLTQLQTKLFVIFGNGLECSVKSISLGLLARHRRVIVVTDACGLWNRGEADLALRQLSAKGATLIESHDLIPLLASDRLRRAQTRARKAPMAPKRPPLPLKNAPHGSTIPCSSPSNPT